jgi:hypothetical protein
MSDEAEAHGLFTQVEALLEEMVAQQRERLVALARTLDPALSADDLLSPDDFPAVSRDPRFNFEDGLLAGLLSARTAIRARVILPGLPAGPEAAPIEDEGTNR